MEHTRASLKAIYDRTGGYCHICHRKMYFTNYGAIGRRGAWEVDHSRAVATGGADHRNNLFGAHISCNRSKGATGTRAVRARHGITRAPKSRAERRQEKKVGQVLTGVAVGGALLWLLAAL